MSVFPLPKADVAAKVDAARANLQQLLALDAGSLAESKKGKELGGLTGLCELITLASLAESSTAGVTDEGMQLFQEAGASLIESRQSYLLNLGVVGALLLSMVYGESFEMLPEHDAPHTLQILHFVCVQLVLTISLFMLFMSCAMHAHLAFAMPTLEAKLAYVRSTARTNMVSQNGPRELRP